MNKLYVVTVCRDFIEGYGPMLLQKIFKTYQEAYDYIQSKPGLYGSNQKIKPSVYKSYCDEGVTQELFNGWELDIVPNDVLIKRLKDVKEEYRDFNLIYTDNHWEATKNVPFNF